ncbi:hypothetical protein [Euzebya pacifica]|nr:hypothetical protein [Euzebya pacifica]
MNDRADETPAARWLRLRGELARARAELSEANGRAARRRADARVAALEAELAGTDPDGGGA